MTFATNLRHAAPRRGGFTLIELLVVVGIILLLMGILLPAVSKIYSSAKTSRTKADLLTIAQGLDAYKADYDGSYPVVTTPNTGAAVLGKALVGAADAAVFYTVAADGTKTADDGVMHNPPAAYNAAQTYQAGEVCTNGAAPNFATWVAGGQTTMYVSIKNDNVGNAPAVPSNWWALFSPYDGNDGPGWRKRLGAAANANGAHAAAGTTFGPYVKPESFHVSGVDLLDSYGSPILYFPVNKAAKVTVGKGLVAFTPAATDPRPLINADDNYCCFFNEAAATTQTPAMMLAKIRVVLGDYNQNGAYDSASEPAPPSESYILWTAGPDKKFGPRGEADPGTFTKYDFYTGTANASENATAQAACDDVTNFR